MSNTLRVFLDTSALFSGIWSETGGARMIFKLGEAGSINIIVSPRVLVEIEGVLRAKAVERLADLAILLDRINVEVTPAPSEESFEKSLALTKHIGDAQMLAGAWHSGVDYFVTLDRQHFLGKMELENAIPFPIGTPGDFLAWFRKRIAIEKPDG